MLLPVPQLGVLKGFQLTVVEAVPCEGLQDSPVGHQGHALLLACPQSLPQLLHTISKQGCTCAQPYMTRMRFAGHHSLFRCQRLPRPLSAAEGQDQPAELRQVREWSWDGPFHTSLGSGSPDVSEQTASGLSGASVVHHTSSSWEKSCPGHCRSSSDLQHTAALTIA